MTLALEIQSLSHSFGKKQVLKDISFTLHSEECTFLLGLNGAGKSTLFSLISGLYHTRHGKVKIFSKDIAQQTSQALANLGVVFQSRSIDVDLTVMQNLNYAGAIYGLPRKEVTNRAESLLGIVGLASRVKDKVSSLSGGQLRRLEIIRALLHEPKLLLFDEPTVGLDIESRSSLLKLIRNLVKERHISVLCSTHITEEVEPSDRVIILHRGKIISHGLVAELTAKAGQTLASTLSQLAESAPENQGSL